MKLLRTLWYVSLPIFGLTLSGCAGKTPRTRWTDKTMRVAIDPASIDANNYVRIQQALVESGKWVVVDRAMAFNAIRHEQERLHRTDSDRFADREKFAIWGRMLGVGGVVVAHAQCSSKGSFWTEARYQHCHQFLSIVDSNSGEVIATSENEEDGATSEESIAPPWDETVARLNAAYPKHFEPRRDQKPLEEYRALAAEEAQRQKEVVAAPAPAPAVANKQGLPTETRDVYNQSAEEQARILEENRKKLGAKQ